MKNEMFQAGKKLKHVDQKTGFSEFDQFIQGFDYLITHGKVDLDNISAFDMFDYMPSSNTQVFFKYVM